jgi:PEP-CTERM motif
MSKALNFRSISFTEGFTPMTRFANLTTLAIGLALASPAKAELLQFELTGSRQASFQLNTDAIPDSFSSSGFGDQIQYHNVPGTYGGVAETATIGFGTSIFAQLNVLADGLGFTQFGGPDLFSGDPMHPTFNLGTFTLTSIVSGASSIEISEVAGAPEPSTWAMMILGSVALGLIARHRKIRPPDLASAT